MRLASRFLMLLVVATLPMIAAADPIPIAGTGTFGSFTGTFDYSALSATEATLVISLTNTSDPANGGFITGFLFNNPGDLTVTNFDPGTYTDFQLVGPESGSPFGDFAFGAALGGDFLGGGSPVTGIAVSDTGTFTFTFSGTGLDQLTSADFFDVFSTGGSDSAAFLVRFKGFENDESDKVPGTVVPEPATMLMMGTGLTALAGIVRRRLKK